MRLLHARHDHPRLAPAPGQPGAERRGNPLRHFGKSLPLHRLSEHRQGDQCRRRGTRSPEGGRRMNVQNPQSTERAEKLQGLGCARRRVEDARFIQGKGHYVDDIKMPGMLFGDFVRSPYGHARIKSIDIGAALKVPGVKAILTASDLKPLKLHYMPTLAGDVQAVLADEKVLFQGQEVAFIIAENRYAAADAVELVDVDYEQLPALIDPFKAMDDDAPVLRDDIKDKMTGAHGPRKHYNHIFTWEVGDKAGTDAALASSDVVADALISCQRGHPSPIQTCGGVGGVAKVNDNRTLCGWFRATHVEGTVESLIA